VPDDLPGQQDRARWPELRSRFAARFLERSQGDWSQSFLGTDACVAPVLSLLEAPADVQLAARGTFVTVDGVLQPAPAPRFGSGAPGTPIDALPASRVAPAGAHTRSVLTEAGFTDVDELLASGAAWQA
jgi:alpha-methylacyl-CoA racemase